MSSIDLMQPGPLAPRSSQEPLSRNFLMPHAVPGPNDEVPLVNALAAHFGALVESSVDAIISKSADGVIMTWNAAAERMFGYTAAEMIGRPVSLLFPPELLERESRLVERIQRGDRIERYESVRLTKHGRRIDVELSISPIRDASGRIIAASKIVHDITERKRTAKQFELLADLLPTMCWMADDQGWIFWYNQRFYEYTGSTFEQLEGWGWQSLHDPAVLPEAMEQWQVSIKTGQPFEMVFPLKGADGVFRPFLTRISPLRRADGRIFRWLGVNADISEERTALETREQFMAVLGHDLRNPLSAIVSGLMLLRKTPLNDRAVMLADGIGDSATRMADLINSIMDLARCRFGDGLALDRAPVDLEPVLRGVIAELVTAMPDRVVETHFALPREIDCDRTRFAQLVSNLLSNAMTYGLPERPIRVHAADGPDGLTLSVANSGKPIPPADLARIFQPFHRGAGRPSQQGLGLGLYIAHEIATAHDGRLEVASTSNETCFTFRMPTT